VATEKQKIPVLVSVHCPKCGHGFTQKQSSAGKTVGGIGGVIAGAKVGAGLGIVGGPLGAIAGTIPGAILGGLFGSKIGRAFSDDAKCPKCGCKFAMPR